jgi:hypothetical protein
VVFTYGHLQVNLTAVLAEGIPTVNTQVCGLPVTTTADVFLIQQAARFNKRGESQVCGQRVHGVLDVSCCKRRVALLQHWASARGARGVGLALQPRDQTLPAQHVPAWQQLGLCEVGLAHSAF